MKELADSLIASVNTGIHIITSAKTFTKRIPVGMGAAKSSETSECQMTDPCLLT